jgi:uncharacterized protein (TIGR01777 family)
MTNNQHTVLITGGSGLVGRYLTTLLLLKGYKVSHLSRTGKSPNNITVFRWDPENSYIDDGALTRADYLVHLAGANIGEKRWTEARKKEIVRSRVDSAKFLFEKIREDPVRLKAFISASAIGYYGSETSERIFTEDDPPGTDFLGSTCRQWEEAADLFAVGGTRTVKIRTGVVLEKTDSALSKIMVPAKFGFLVKTGNGRQYMPWIHIKDLCNIYIKAIEDSKMQGAFNAVAPQHITHNEFVATLAKTIKKIVFPVNVPAFVLKAALGEMSDVVLKGSRVSGDRIINAGYRFIYPGTEGALEDILKQTLFY